jgi:hypothetical protein
MGLNDCICRYLKDLRDQNNMSNHVIRVCCSIFPRLLKVYNTSEGVESDPKSFAVPRFICAQQPSTAYKFCAYQVVHRNSPAQRALQSRESPDLLA